MPVIFFPSTMALNIGLVCVHPIILCLQAVIVFHRLQNKPKHTSSQLKFVNCVCYRKLYMNTIVKEYKRSDHKTGIRFIQEFLKIDENGIRNE